MELERVLEGADAIEKIVRQKALQQVATKDLDGLLDYYKMVLDELDRLGATKDILRLALVQHFKENNLRSYAGEGVKAWVNTRISHFISMNEAKELLPPDLFEKLVKESISVVLNIRRSKNE